MDFFFINKSKENICWGKTLIAHWMSKTSKKMKLKAGIDEDYLLLLYYYIQRYEITARNNNWSYLFNFRFFFFRIIALETFMIMKAIYLFIPLIPACI